MSLVDWGDVPTWIGGAGALAAGWFAYQTIRSQRQQIGEQQEFIAQQMTFMDEQRENLRLERLALEDQANQRLRAQADKVELRVRRNIVGVRPEIEAQWIVEVVNMSAEPIREVSIRFGSLEPARVQARGLRPGEAVVPVLGAGRTATFHSQTVGEMELERYSPTATFTDNSGVPWQKDTLGNLTEDCESSDGAS